MLRHLFCAAVVVGVLAGRAGAAEPNGKFGGDNAEWGALPKSNVVVPATTASCPDAPPKRCGRTPPPMFGDIITCGFNQGLNGFQQFNGGFQLQGFQQFNGGLQQFQGGLQGFQQFNGGLQQFQGGLQGGFNQGLQQGFQGSPFSLPRSGSVPIPAVLAAANAGSIPASYALPQTFRGPFKIAHNESPRPQDRVHIQYDYGNNIRNFGDYHSETPGAELAFLDNRVSIGIRVPGVQIVGRTVASDSEFGDISIPIKVLLMEDAANGSMVSAGIVITPPTGQNPSVFSVSPDGFLVLAHPTLLQPFVGYIWNRGAFYVQGFSAIGVPTENVDGTWMFNDIAAGYWFDTGGWVQAIVPTFELHVNTPLNHRESLAPLFFDSVNITAGAHFYLSERLSIGAAMGTCLTGPQAYDFNAIANLNFVF